jgi:hypothetical protein
MFNGKTLIENMIFNAMSADKSVKIEESAFEPAAIDPWDSGESVVFLIGLKNNQSRAKLHLLVS